MSTAAKILIGLVAAGVLMFGATACTAISFNNGCVDLENQLKAQWEKNQAVYDTMWKSVQETAGVAEAHADKVKEIAIATIEGRYKNDNQVLFKAIAEANGQPLPADLYKKVQQIIEAKRNEFQANQTTLVAMKQTYNNKLQKFPGSVYAGVMGFPRIKMEDYEIVTSSKTKKTFETKEDNEPMSPFAKKGS